MTDARGIETIRPPSPFRSILARFRLAADGGHSDLATTTLRSVIAGKTALQPFAQIPCKENGVDIEGLAVRDGLLRVGFRGPVYQRGFVPVLTCTFANPVTAADTLYLNLGGRGIRDLERVEGGFLVLAGPVSDVPVSFQLYFWDGTDCVPGGAAATAPGSSRLDGRNVSIGRSSAKQLTRLGFTEVYSDFSGKNVFLNLDAGLIEIDDLNAWTAQVRGIGTVGSLVDLSGSHLSLSLVGCRVVGVGALSGQPTDGGGDQRPLLPLQGGRRVRVPR